MDVWITFRLLEDASGRDCRDDNESSGAKRQEIFTFPEPDPPGFELNGTFVSYGPSIGQMTKAICERHQVHDAVILDTKFGSQLPAD